MKKYDKLRKCAKYLNVLPLVMCMAFAVYFMTLFNSAANTVTEKEFTGRVQTINLLVDTIEYHDALVDDNESEFLYKEILASVGIMDKNTNTLAAVLDDDMGLMTARTTKDNAEAMELLPFLIENYSERFLSGTVSEAFDAPYGDTIIKVYYRWVQSEEDNPHKFMFITGMKPSQSTPYDNKFIAAAYALTLSTVVLDYILMAKTKQLTHKLNSLEAEHGN
jgi:hypothetical protein